MNALKIAPSNIIDGYGMKKETHFERIKVLSFLTEISGKRKLESVMLRKSADESIHSILDILKDIEIEVS